MMIMIGQRIHLYAITFAIVALPTGALADNSSVEDFTSIVNTGAIKQTTSGSNNRQDLNVGSANSTKANSFNATVTTGSITQSSSGTGIVQITNIGSATNAKVGSFNATVNTGKIEQVSTRSGDRQELDIGSVSNSTVNGAFKVNVNVKEGVKQTGSGEIVLGSVKNSNVQDFSTTLDVKGKVTGNNIRIGSIVGGERFDKQGRSQGQDQNSENGSNGSLEMPASFSANNGDNNSECSTGSCNGNGNSLDRGPMQNSENKYELRQWNSQQEANEAYYRSIGKFPDKKNNIILETSNNILGKISWVTEPITNTVEYGAKKMNLIEGEINDPWLELFSHLIPYGGFILSAPEAQ